MKSRVLLIGRLLSVQLLAGRSTLPTREGGPVGWWCSADGLAGLGLVVWGDVRGLDDLGGRGLGRRSRSRRLRVGDADHRRAQHAVAAPEARTQHGGGGRL